MHLPLNFPGKFLALTSSKFTMEWATVISLVLIGIALVVVEIIFIPGTTIAGVLGFCLVLAGVVVSFNFFGKTTGWLVLGGSVLLTGGMIVWSLRSKAWERFSLKSTIDSKVNEGATEGLKVGEVGIAVSSLRPSGKADFNGKQYEVTTLGNFVDNGTKLKILSISTHQIIVEPDNLK